MNTTSKSIAARLEELLAITDAAQRHADNNNIAGVSICITRRRFIIEQTHCLYGLAGTLDGDIRPLMEKLRQKDICLKQTLECRGLQVRQEQERLIKKSVSRSRYSGTGKRSPRFIDKKA